MRGIRCTEIIAHSGAKHIEGSICLAVDEFKCIEAGYNPYSIAVIVPSALSSTAVFYAGSETHGPVV